MKKVYQVAVLIAGLAVGGYVGDKVIPKAYGGSVKVTNSSVALEAESDTYNKHMSGANEKNDIYDIPHLASEFSLDIFTYNNQLGSNLGTDSRNTTSITPFEIKLKANNYIADADNSLKFKVFNSDGTLNHRKIFAYNATNPNNLIEIPNLNGTELSIPLPNLVNQPAGIYANWRVEMPRIIEGDINEDGKCNFEDFV